MWTPTEDMLVMNEEVLYPLGTVVSNPKHNATALTLIFDRLKGNLFNTHLLDTFSIFSYGQEQTVMYPATDTLIRHAKERNRNELNIDVSNMSEEELANCQKLITENDSFYELYDQDRARIWRLRYRWMGYYPDILPKLLHCIDWNNKDVISEAVCLLRDWPNLPFEKALELLDYAYADQEVRSFAVQCLKDVG